MENEMKMKNILIMFIAVACIGIYGAESKQTKAQFNKQIAILESKVFKLENENKKLKTEIGKKDKAINALAMRIAGQPAKSKATTNSSYAPIEAQRKAAQLAAEQQKKQRARQLAIIDQKIKYYEKQKQGLEKEYAEATKKTHDAKYILGRSKRKEAIQKALESQNEIKSKISNVDYNIDSLKRQRLNYL